MIRLQVTCDICGCEQEFDAPPEFNEYAVDRELEMDGWWTIDFRNICPNHPQSVTS